MVLRWSKKIFNIKFTLGTWHAYVVKGKTSFGNCPINCYIESPLDQSSPISKRIFIELVH